MKNERRKTELSITIYKPNICMPLLTKTPFLRMTSVFLNNGGIANQTVACVERMLWTLGVGKDILSPPRKFRLCILQYVRSSVTAAVCAWLVVHNMCWIWIGGGGCVTCGGLIVFAAVVITASATVLQETDWSLFSCKSTARLSRLGSDRHLPMRAEERWFQLWYNFCDYTTTTRQPTKVYMASFEPTVRYDRYLLRPFSVTATVRLYI